jgi:NAD(P)-dependent dehydrogenase (short-subunit alcohol dehydrogenase family)
MTGTRLQDRVAIITGGGSGIGKATALLFASEGAKLCIVDRYDDAAEAVAADIKTMGGEAIICVGDVGEAGLAEEHTAACLEAFGRVDVLMTAAGFSTGGTATTITPENWDAVIRANLTGTWLWLRAVLPAMQKQGSGSIITIASQMARAGGRNNVAYIAAKAGILGLTYTTALDFVADGIRVNAILPGAIETPLLRRSFARSPTPEATREASRLRHPMGRFGRDEEVAQAALYLASDASTFTTGTELVVDGGWLAG